MIEYSSTFFRSSLNKDILYTSGFIGETDLLALYILVWVTDDLYFHSDIWTTELPVGFLLGSVST